ncbi:RNA 2',3'-cyclic phosphodiesterase [Komagataeibacter oboediens]|uniref:RNA 2',3'-cyclic phosphodiesterase n=1 Tax=Komagataeibacter oboediens TaxID=65958 RepID=A0ABS5SK29_9PROT|nr:RNA 2',3'-cyclic phosphodiesterase [Komagataeibacter oboediens]MBL7234549.1 RNA 2',3'-cyclic phosphodiesterase [Komagataeibacter oboediens]MBT0673865.1 RNA 2',3'-cyclic phosphodiesterase [Komagataeibacter oboediens]MBT0677412.1 RNA 2',3'-cyclic phosphodiesterase [Komagataeibacter oboediens]
MRLFVGLELPPSLLHAIAGLRGSLPDVTWLPPESYHLTLHFIGEVTHGHLLEEIHHTLSAIRSTPPVLQPGGAGLFMTSRPHGSDTLWIGCAPDAALLSLRDRIRKGLNRAIPPGEKNSRHFTPHITMGRMDHPDQVRRQRWLATTLPPVAAQAIGHFTLFQSMRHADGPVYEPLEHYPLRF